jgi:hypothetical protein
MEENGALLNRDQLANAHVLIRSLAAKPGPGTRSQSKTRRRSGDVQKTVIRALAAVDRPLRAREIHATARNGPKRRFSWNTVKDCLHKRARRADSPIERVSHGRYRHR